MMQLEYTPSVLEEEDQGTGATESKLPTNPRPVGGTLRTRLNTADASERRWYSGAFDARCRIDLDPVRDEHRRTSAASIAKWWGKTQGCASSGALLSDIDVDLDTVEALEAAYHSSSEHLVTAESPSLAQVKDWFRCSARGGEHEAAPEMRAASENVHSHIDAQLAALDALVRNKERRRASRLIFRLFSWLEEKASPTDVYHALHRIDVSALTSFELKTLLVASRPLVGGTEEYLALRKRCHERLEKEVGRKVAAKLLAGV